MKDRKKPEQFLLPHGMPSDDRECAFSSRVPPKALKIKAPYKSWHYQFIRSIYFQDPDGITLQSRVAAQRSWHTGAAWPQSWRPGGVTGAVTRTRGGGGPRLSILAAPCSPTSV